MNFKNFVLGAAILFSSLTSASTGWSGKQTELDSIVKNKIIEMYEAKCSASAMKSFVLHPIVSIERLDSAVDYLGSSAPLYNINLNIYSTFERDYINQEFTVEVLYLQLSQEFLVNLAENTTFECVN